MATSKKGPGRSSRVGRSQGRVTGPARHTGTSTGRYLSAEERGRYTAPTPKSEYHSPSWYAPMLMALFLIGLLTLILNYLSVLPGGVSAWYLLVGLGFIVAGFLALIRYR